MIGERRIGFLALELGLVGCFTLLARRAWACADSDGLVSHPPGAAASGVSQHRFRHGRSDGAKRQRSA